MNGKEKDLKETDHLISQTPEGQDALYEADRQEHKQVVRVNVGQCYCGVNATWLSNRAHDDLRGGWVAECQLDLYGVPRSEAVRDALWVQGGEKWHHLKIKGLVRERFFRIGDLIKFAERDPLALEI